LAVVQRVNRIKPTKLAEKDPVLFLLPLPQLVVVGVKDITIQVQLM
jgi:hypothetical protein